MDVHIWLCYRFSEVSSLLSSQILTVVGQKENYVLLAAFVWSTLNPGNQHCRGQGKGREGRGSRSLREGRPSQGVWRGHHDDGQGPLTWPRHPVERGVNNAVNNTSGSWRRMSPVISGDVFRLCTANFSTDKEPSSQRGGLKILETRKSQVEGMNEAKRACCWVPTINDRLSYCSCSCGERCGKDKKLEGEKKRSRGCFHRVPLVQQ